MNLTRRQFLASAVLAAGCPRAGAAVAPPERLAFFFLADTHYLANRDRPRELDPTSRAHTSRLVDWLNRLPGSAISASAGGGTVAVPRGVVHGGDVIDSGDRTGAPYLEMQRTEWRAFEEDFGLTGRDGKLRCPVYEVHGNHDSPGGTGLAIDAIKRRNRNRPGLAHLSANGLHYSWDWGPLHFVNLGIVVGSVREVTRRRRYAPLDSLAFLIDDLARNARDRRRPVFLTHHVDVARYSGPCDPAARVSPEWDPCDVRGYHAALKGHPIAAVAYGHTHARNVFRWDGTRARKEVGDIPVFNVDKASHFRGKAQAFFYVEVTGGELVVREFATRDGWRTGNWSPAVWRVPLGPA